MTGVSPSRRRRHARRRASARAVALAAALVVAAAAALVLAVALRGPRLPSPTARGKVPSSAPVSAAAKPITRIAVRSLGAVLPTPLEGLGAAVMGGTVYLVGGSGPAGFSDTIYAYRPGASAATAVGTLPQALHDVGVAAAGGVLYVCGGGQSVGTRSVYAWSPGHAAALVGNLPGTMSDMAGVVAPGGPPLCLGGWDGSQYSDAVYAAAPKAGARSGGPVLWGRLTMAVRYAAAAPLGDGVIVAGGMDASGRPVAAVQWLGRGGGARTVAAVQAAPLPVAVDYTMGAPLGGEALVIGGCTAQGWQASEVWAIASPTARPASVGAMPHGVCYGAAAAVGQTVYVFGGAVRAGPTADAWAVTVARRG